MKNDLTRPYAFLKEMLPLILAMGALGAAAQQGERNRIRTKEIDGVVWKYRVQGDHAVIASGDRDIPAIPAGTAGRVVVPREIDGFGVWRVGVGAFAGCNRLEEVVLPSPENRFLEIGPELFARCRSLRRVVFPEHFRLFAAAQKGMGKDLLHGCDALEEIVFLGDVPGKEVLLLLGASLDGRLRYTEKYAPQWEAYAKDNGIAGGRLCDPGLASPDGSPPRQACPEDVPVDMSLAAYRTNGPIQDSIKGLSDGFSAYLQKVDADYGQEKKALLAKRREALLKNKARAQAAGDLDAVVAFEAALKSDLPVETGVETLREVYKQYAAADANLLKRCDERRAKAAETMAERLEAIKVKETKAGNVEVAKEVDAYEDRVKALAESLRKRIAACSAVAGADGGEAPAEAAPAAGAKAAAPQGISGRISISGAVATSVTVSADDERGTLIGGGGFEKGDLMVVQYIGGSLSLNPAGKHSFNPDSRDGRFRNKQGRGIVKISGPDKSRDETEQVLPLDTEHGPYVFEVPATGRYRLICFLGSRAQGKAAFQVLRVTKSNAQKFKDSPLSKQCQW